MQAIYILRPTTIDIIPCLATRVLHHRCAVHRLYPLTTQELQGPARPMANPAVSLWIKANAPTAPSIPITAPDRTGVAVRRWGSLLDVEAQAASTGGVIALAAVR